MNTNNRWRAWRESRRVWAGGSSDVQPLYVKPKTQPKQPEPKPESKPEADAPTE
jgi:hypothetical protein